MSRVKQLPLFSGGDKLAVSDSGSNDSPWWANRGTCLLERVSGETRETRQSENVVEAYIAQMAFGRHTEWFVVGICLDAILWRKLSGEWARRETTVKLVSNTVALQF